VCVCREKLHARILLGSQTFVSPNSISRICCCSIQNFVLSHSNHLPRTIHPRSTLRYSFFYPSKVTARTFLKLRNDAAEEERGVFMCRTRSLVAKLLKHRARRSNTEYHRQTLISSAATRSTRFAIQLSRIFTCSRSCLDETNLNPNRCQDDILE